MSVGLAWCHLANVYYMLYCQPIENVAERERDKPSLELLNDNEHLHLEWNFQAFYANKPIDCIRA